MTVFKSGDLVVLKSGGPVMTIDTVNTDIFDDSKITGVLCAWFVGTRLERVRFDHSAIEPAQTETVVAPETAAPQTPKTRWKEIRRRYYRVGSSPASGERSLFNPVKVGTTRYRYRGAAIPTPWPTTG